MAVRIMPGDTAFTLMEGAYSIRELRAAHPDLHIVLTHLGEQVDTGSMPGVTIPADFERLTV